MVTRQECENGSLEPCEECKAYYESSMGIKAHCMGTEFPKRDTDSPDVIWESAVPTLGRSVILPSAADLDAVAEEQRVKDKTSNPANA